MDKKKIYDHIDSELSRIYFGKPAVYPPKEEKKEAEKQPEVIPPVPPARVKSGRTTFTLAFLVIAVSAAFSLYFFMASNRTASVPDVTGPSAGPLVEEVSGTELDDMSENPRVHTDGNVSVFYDFEEDTEGWEIPSWAFEKPDHVAKNLTQSREFSSNGTGSLRLEAEFPGGKWTGAFITISHYLDITEFEVISADIFVPENCPPGLRAKFILTVGRDWTFTEMSRSVKLAPGEWTTITADISSESLDWRRTKVDGNFRSDIRKIGLRIESDARPVYAGPVYIDNIRLWKEKDIEQLQ